MTKHVWCHWGLAGLCALCYNVLHIHILICIIKADANIACKSASLNFVTPKKKNKSKTKNNCTQYILDSHLLNWVDWFLPALQLCKLSVTWQMPCHIKILFNTPTNTLGWLFIVTSGFSYKIGSLHVVRIVHGKVQMCSACVWNLETLACKFFI